MSASAVATRSRASTTFSSSPSSIRRTASATTRLPLGAAQRAVGERARRAGAAGGAGVAPSVGARAIVAGADGGHPRGVAAAADDDLGDDQHAVAGVVGERERAEADQPGAGQRRPRRGPRRCAVVLGPPGRWRPRTGPGPTYARSRPRPSRPGPRRGAPRRWRRGQSGSSASSGPGSSTRTVRTTSGADRGSRTRPGLAVPEGSVTRRQPTASGRRRPPDRQAAARRLHRVTS